MKLSSFIARCVVVTLCVCFVLEACTPKYVFLEKDVRCNRISGKVERNSSPHGWLKS